MTLFVQTLMKKQNFLALIERFDAILKDNRSKVIESKDWEERRSLIEANGYREGIYHIVKVSSPSSANAVSEFDRLAKINDSIIRH